MAFADKAAENKRVAEKCMEMEAYNAGVTRAYYSAFLLIKGYLTDKRFDYEGFLRKKGLNDKVFSHGTLQAAATDCLMKNGKKPVDVYKLLVLSSLYEKRQRADYQRGNILKNELITSLKDLNTVLSVVT